MAPDRVTVFGHGRVDGVGAPLNTLASFGECRRRGADGVELDVRRTGDDRLVVLHDATFEGHPIDETDSGELPRDVPHLAEALDECRGLTVNIELKNFPSDPGFDPRQRLTHLVIELLGQRDGDDQVLLSCFDLAALDLVLREAPWLPTAVLLLSRRSPRALLAPVVEHGHLVVHPYDTMVDEGFMALARDAGLAVNPWLGDVGAGRMQELLGLGVDGLITSEVSTARAVVDRHRGQARAS